MLVSEGTADQADSRKQKATVVQRISVFTKRTSQVLHWEGVILRKWEVTDIKFLNITQNESSV